MSGYLVSLLMGLAVGAAYGLVQVRSPAPPMIALVGLFGMVLGQQAIDMAKRHRADNENEMPRRLLRAGCFYGANHIKRWCDLIAIG